MASAAAAPPVAEKAKDGEGKDLQQEMLAFRAKLVNLARELLVTKSTSTTAGIMLHYSITFTVIATLFMGNAKATLSPADKPDKQTITNAFLVTTIVFFGLLVGAVFLTRFIQGVERIPQQAKDTYCAGIRLIPAWAWKDVILNTHALLVIQGVIAKDDSAAVTTFAINVSLVSALVYLILQACTANLDKDNLAKNVVLGLMTSFALGCGWATNAAVRSYIEPKAFKEMNFCIMYAAAGTILTPLLQYILNELTKVVKERAPDGATATVAFCKAMEFIGLSLNFVMGWGWKSLLDLMTAGMRATPLQNFQAALFVTAICILSPAIIGIIGAPKVVNSSLALAAGMNIGWSWCDLIMNTMKAQSVLNMAIVWGTCLGALVAVVIFAEIADRIIRLFEHFEDYVHMPPIKVPGMDVEYGSTGGSSSGPPAAKSKAAPAP